MYFTACLMFASAVSSAAVRVTNLTTLYQHNPIGIDERPTFSWQLMSDDAGVMQRAYQIVVALSESDLRRGRYVYDSGRVEDGRSVQIPYKGHLMARTRYYYKVRIWDSRNVVSRYSSTSWFETGLMGGGLEGAEWIGSPKVFLSPYRSSYVIEYEVRPNDTPFVFGCRNASNYNIVALSDSTLAIGHYVGGRYHEDAREDVSSLVRATNHVRLNVFASQYCKTYRMDVALNDSAVSNTHKDASRLPQTLLERVMAGKQAEFEINPLDGMTAADIPLFYNARLYDFGFLGSKSAAIVEAALVKDEKRHALRIVSPSWGTTLWTAGGDAEAHSAPMLRKQFSAHGPIVKARLYASAQGIYECYINGQRVGADLFAPGWPDYRCRMFYNTYDVTASLRQGVNTIGVCLGTGWWSDFMGYQTYWQDQYGVRQTFAGMLVVAYADGSTDTIVTDGTWRCCTDGPVRGNSIQNGECYDATKECQGWADTGFDDSLWQPVQATAVQTPLMAYVGDAVQARDTLCAVSMTHPTPGTYIYDMGQNMAGIPSISVNGRYGQKLTLRYAEMLWPEEAPSDPVAPYTSEMYRRRRGALYTDNYRSALSTDTYICKGGSETIEPRFTQHGYRYVQIEGLDAPLPLEAVRGLVMHSMAGPQTCHIETSDTLVNRLFSNIVWGQRGNFLAVPSDCPQRDERLGYTGDGQIFARSAMYNYQVDPFFRRWLYAVRDNQDAEGCFADYSPKVDTPPSKSNGGGVMGWAEAGIIVPWQMYVQYADLDILVTSWPSMKRYMDYLEGKAEGYLQPAGGLGDWLGFEETNSQITNTSFYAYEATLMAKIAHVLHKDDEARHYEALFDSIKCQFNRTFVRPDGTTYTPAGYKKGKWFPKVIAQDETEDTQTSYVLPLKAWLFDSPELAVDKLCQAIARRNGHLSTGFVATPYLNTVLSDHDCSDVAYGLFLNRDCPSWLYPVTQGATTVWERWNSYTREHGFGPVNMNSFNHYSYGAVEEWMVQYMLGIRADESEPGYKHFFIEPQFSPTLDYVRGHYLSMYGRIECQWKKAASGYILDVVVPPNTTATVNVGGKACEVASGRHRFVCDR